MAIGNHGEKKGFIGEILLTVPTTEKRSQAVIDSFLMIMADTGGHFDFYKEIAEFLFFLYVPMLFKSYVVSSVYYEKSSDEKNKFSR